VLGRRCRAEAITALPVAPHDWDQCNTALPSPWSGRATASVIEDFADITSSAPSAFNSATCSAARTT